MKIFIVGASGTIGNAVCNELGSRHDIIRGSLNSSDIQIDITQIESIRSAFKKIGRIDALVSTTGQAVFKGLSEMREEDYLVGINNKLMGQVNLVSIGLDYINEAGSFTLTSGILTHDPIRFGTSASMVNGAIESFVKAAAIEMPLGRRINAVSPTVILESLDKYRPYFRGYQPVPAYVAALGYAKSVEGLQTGKIFDAF